MKKPSQELIDAFFNWYHRADHSKNEDYYKEKITTEYLSGLSKIDFIDFFYKFASDGGKLQSGGHRTSGKFRQTIEAQYGQFRTFVMKPFSSDFDIENWLAERENFKNFGIGIATIYLNRVDKNRFCILNNKTSEALKLFGVSLSNNLSTSYQTVYQAQQQMIDWFPQFENFYRTDSLNQFLIGEEEGRFWKDSLNNAEQENGIRYWIYAPGRNAKYWDVCWENSIMLYGADELTDLRTYESKTAIEKAIMEAYERQAKPINDALAAWEFSRVIKPGDIIIVKRGTKQYIGYGIVTGSYFHDTQRDTYRHSRTINWKKKGEWNEDKGPIVLKTLTDVTKYPDYIERLSNLIGIEDSEPKQKRPALNTILYGPPGTGKTYSLRNHFMQLFTESHAVSQDQFAKELSGELTWFQVIAVALYDLKSAKVPAIYNHSLIQAKIQLQTNQNPKNSIWAWLQRHTKIDCPHVKHTQRDEPLIFWKDENSTWTVDRDMVDEQLPELVSLLDKYKNFKPNSMEIKRFEYVTFHQSYCYEDFIEGIKPVMSEAVSDALSYEIKPGIFKTMVNRALSDPDHDYAILIDEINRGNVASIFGELIALIEEDKRKGAPNEIRAQLPYSRQEFVVPKNLYIIGAMNTADRSVEALDTALRRRFVFVSMPPQPALITQPDNFEVDIQRLLITVNARIERLLDKDHCIGHSFFMGVFQSDDPLNELRKIFATKILPLLEEYFYGDPAKIGMVLGEGFIKRNDEIVEWTTGDWGMEDYEERSVYRLKDPMTITIEAFHSVYEKSLLSKNEIL